MLHHVHPLACMPNTRSYNQAPRSNPCVALQQLAAQQQLQKRQYLTSRMRGSTRTSTEWNISYEPI